MSWKGADLTSNYYVGYINVDASLDVKISDTSLKLKLCPEILGIVMDARFTLHYMTRLFNSSSRSLPLHQQQRLHKDENWRIFFMCLSKLFLLTPFQQPVAIERLVVILLLDVYDIKSVGIEDYLGVAVFFVMK